MEAHDLIFLVGALGVGLIQVVVLLDEVRRSAWRRSRTKSVRSLGEGVRGT